MKGFISEFIILRRRRAHRRYDLKGRIHLKLIENGRVTGVLLKNIYFKCRRKVLPCASVPKKPKKSLILANRQDLLSVTCLHL